MTEAADALRRHLRLGLGESLFGVVDAARDLELAFEAKCLYSQEIHSLFAGDVAPALAEVAPYVVPIQPDSGYLENWTRRWGDSAGILLVTRDSVDRLREHLRQIFVVTDEDDQEYFFRYYDPAGSSVDIASDEETGDLTVRGPSERNYRFRHASNGRIREVEYPDGTKTQYEEHEHG
jgi:hypothetical protein